MGKRKPTWERICELVEQLDLVEDELSDLNADLQSRVLARLAKRLGTVSKKLQSCALETEKMDDEIIGLKMSRDDLRLDDDLKAEPESVESGGDENARMEESGQAKLWN